MRIISQVAFLYPCSSSFLLNIYFLVRMQVHYQEKMSRRGDGLMSYQQNSAANLNPSGSNFLKSCHQIDVTSGPFNLQPLF